MFRCFDVSILLFLLFVVFDFFDVSFGGLVVGFFDVLIFRCFDFSMF